MIYKMQDIFQTEPQILPCPEYRKKKTLKKTLALEEGDITFHLTPTPTLLMNTDTSQKFELPVPFPLLSVHEDIYFLLGTFLTYFLLEINIYNKGDSVVNKTTLRQISNKRNKYKSVYNNYKVYEQMYSLYIQDLVFPECSQRELRDFRSTSDPEANLLAFIGELLALFSPFFR